jgi:hypothetical protein
LSAFGLKLAAAVFMTLDHLAKAGGGRLFLRFFPFGAGAAFWALSSLKWLGRISFPLFAFALAESCGKTRSMARLAARLAVFAVVSEPCYYLALGRHYNIFVVLAAGALLVWAFQFFRAKKKAALVVPLLAAVALAFAFFQAYSDIFCALLIFALYVCPTKKSRALCIVLWSAVLYLLWPLAGEACRIVLKTWPGLPPSRKAREAAAWALPFVFSCLGALFVSRYGGQRGKPAKWAFYFYYPAHLAALAVLVKFFSG